MSQAHRFYSKQPMHSVLYYSTRCTRYAVLLSSQVLMTRMTRIHTYRKVPKPTVGIFHPSRSTLWDGSSEGMRYYWHVQMHFDFQDGPEHTQAKTARREDERSQYDHCRSNAAFRTSSALRACVDTSVYTSLPPICSR